MSARYHRRRAEFIALLGGKCSKCGRKDALEFDHIDRFSKTFNVAKAIGTWAHERVLTEIKKCQLLCSDCHRSKTLDDLGRKSARGTHGTLSSYRYCRCGECRKAKSDWQKNKYGRVAQLATAPGS